MQTVETNDVVAVPHTSLATAAMLVEMNVSCWTGRKLDKKATATTIAANNAAKGVAAVHKRLLGDCPELDAITKFVSSARVLHYSSTMPWSDSGLRLLPTKAFFKYQELITGLQTEFDRLVSVFLDAYDWEISQSELRLGSLFCRDEYPLRSSLEHKFSFRINYMPLPDAGDFRLDVGNDTLKEVADAYATFYKKQHENAMRDVWKRAYDALDKMSERLTDGENGRKVFRDSLVDNVLDAIELLDVCNITNDPVMDAAKRKLAHTMRGVTADQLRESPTLRHETRKKVDEVRATIDNLPGLGW